MCARKTSRQNNNDTNHPDEDVRNVASPRMFKNRQIQDEDLYLMERGINPHELTPEERLELLNQEDVEDIDNTASSGSVIGDEDDKSNVG